MERMHPDTLLSVHLGALTGRDKYSTDPAVHAAVIAELRALAGVRTDTLHAEVGRWVGYYGDDHTAARCSALLAAFPGALPYIREGQERRQKPAHGTYEVR